jgi:hypothetical protein
MSGYRIQGWVFFVILSILLICLIIKTLPKETNVTFQVEQISEEDRVLLESDFINYNFIASYNKMLYDTIKIINPYRKGLYYKMVSSLEGDFNYSYTDIGTKDKLIKLKCKRYNQLIKMKDSVLNIDKQIDLEINEIITKTCK